MRVLMDAPFYSNSRTGLDEVTNDDRELLVQEQKACRARARQYCLETNRRRKAQEDRRKQWDAQEQRLRENILKQRKQKLQDATERFQRAHLHPNQRRRPATNHRALNLDEALSNIQGSPSSYFHPPLFSGCPISRSCTPSPNPPGGSSGPRSLHAVSVAQAYAKLMQEQSLKDFKTSQILFINQLQETEAPLKHLEKLQAQEHRDTPVSPAESLSSLDSLENELPQQDRHSKPASLDPPETHNTRNSPSHLKLLNSSCPSSNLCSSKSFLEEVVSQQGQESCSSTPPPFPREDESVNEDQNVQDPSKAAEQCSVTHQSQAFNTESTPGCQNLHHKQGIVTHSKLKTVSGTTPLEVSHLTHKYSFDSGDLAKCGKHPSETWTALGARDTLFKSYFRSASEVSSSFENSALQKIDAESACQLSKTKLDVGVVYELETKFEGYEKFKRPDQASLTDESSLSKITEQPEKTSEPLNSHLNLKSSSVHFLKGILKKKAKYTGDGDAKITYTKGHFVFNKQVAMAIRDSLELAKAKSRHPEINKSMKKRLRWFDEANIVGGGSEERVNKVNKDTSKQGEANNTLIEAVDQQQVAYHLGIPKNNMDCSGLTKQVWSYVDAQERRQQKPTEKSKREKAVRHVNGHCISHQMRSARISSCPVSSSIVQREVRTQGKTMVPRPPPKSKSNSAPGYATKTTNNYEHSRGKSGLAAEQVLYKDNPGGYMLVPPSNAYTYETVSKGIYTLCQAESQVSSSKNGFHNGLCLDRTPTDEEISLLWNDVRFALTNKDGDAQNVTTQNVSSSALPQALVTLSHVNTNFDNMVSGVKTEARMDNSSISSPNVRCSVRRPTSESNMVKGRTYVDHSRIQLTARGEKKCEKNIVHQASVPGDGHKSKTQLMVHSDGSEVMDGDKQVSINSSHLQRTPLYQQCQQGLSTLSLEEQKLLQSLDRLNHRLQYVQDMAPRNTALKCVPTLDSAYNKSPQPGKAACATLHKYHSSSSVGHAQSHRRY